MRLKAGDQLDRFEILEPLGEGAYAETYKARDTRNGETVLIKSPNPLLFADPAIHQRFMREAEIARHLNHPGVQRSIDTADHRSEPYLAMEYIEGETLRSWLRKHQPPLPIPQALEWGRQLAEALAYLHAHKIVHRDLKPENIIVTTDGKLKIIDFGTALLEGARRLTWRHLTEALGTPDYMSPEQIQGDRGDNRSDIYAWGILMYEFLTGHVPFQGDNWLAVMAGHLQRDPEPIRKQRPEVPPDVEAVVMAAMRRYPENRYQSADDLLRDLQALAAHRATTAAASAPAASHSTPAPPPGHSTPAPPAASPAAHSPASPPATSQPVRPQVPAYGSSRRASSAGRLPAPAASSAGPQPAPTPSGARLWATSQDFSPEKPIGRLPAPTSSKSLWGFVAMIGGGFVGVVAVIIVLSLVLR